MKVYLDNNATTPLREEVKEAIREFLPYFGNPGSLHEDGRDARVRIDHAREQVARFFGAPAHDLIFTSCGSEANNTILKSVLYRNYNFTPHVIVSNIEHPSVLETARFLQKRGVDVTFLPVRDNGVVDIDDFKSELKKETVLVSIMYANNEIGTIQPIYEIGNILRERNIFFHTDAVQVPGKIPVNLRELPVDAASFSAHKMYAPKGIGLLYIRDFKKNGRHIEKLIHGGHQEQNFRAGTENTLGIIAFGAAAESLGRTIEPDIIRVRSLRDRFESMVRERIPDIIVNAAGAPRKPCTTNITFKYIEGESIILRLDLHGISVSTGSACSTGSLDPSHVIMAISHDREIAHGSVRFSFGPENTDEDVDYTVSVLEKEIAFLRAISPLGNKKVQTQVPASSECPVCSSGSGTGSA